MSVVFEKKNRSGIFREKDSGRAASVDRRELFDKQANWVNGPRLDGSKKEKTEIEPNGFLRDDGKKCVLRARMKT